VLFRSLRYLVILGLAVLLLLAATDAGLRLMLKNVERNSLVARSFVEEHYPGVVIKGGSDRPAGITTSTHFIVGTQNSELVMVYVVGVAPVSWTV